MNNNIKIGIFCSSSPLLRQPKESDYSFLRSKGFHIYEHPQVRKLYGHQAGTISERVSAIHEMLSDDSIDVLMAYWGGLILINCYLIWIMNFSKNILSL